MRRAVLAAFLSTTLSVSTAAPGRAQIAPSPDPIYHGVLRINPAVATLDLSTGTATIKVRRWGLLLNPQESNGIYPDQEPILLALGEADRFYLAAGSLKPMRRGKGWTYRSDLKADDRGIKSLTIKRLPDGSYLVRFTLVGVDLSRLIFELEGVCVSTAVIVGDDDGFTGINVTRKNTRTRRVLIPDECEPQEWPWG
jgi:hypothetical protein